MPTDKSRPLMSDAVCIGNLRGAGRDKHTLSEAFEGSLESGMTTKSRRRNKVDQVSDTQINPLARDLGFSLEHTSPGQQQDPDHPRSFGPQAPIIEKLFFSFSFPSRRPRKLEMKRNQ